MPLKQSVSVESSSSFGTKQLEQKCRSSRSNKMIAPINRSKANIKCKQVGSSFIQFPRQNHSSIFSFSKWRSSLNNYICCWRNKTNFTDNVVVYLGLLFASIMNWASSWDYGTYHIGDQGMLSRSCAVSPSRQSLRCSHKLSMEVDEGSDQQSDI